MTGDVESRYNEILKQIGKDSIGKRPRIVIRHILEYGSITTETLTKKYGYEHPPRAIRDVKDLGIPLVRKSTKNAAGKTIAIYVFSTKEEIVRLGGRIPFPKGFKERISKSERCWLCGTYFKMRYLQVDHRVPFPISGDAGDMDPSHFMLLCGSCNRSKSWSCEHCPNWKCGKDEETCKTCYWANPESHTHAATINIRRLDVTWQGDEVPYYDKIVNDAKEVDQNVPDYIKGKLRDLTG